MNRVFIINGSGGCGKGTFIKSCIHVNQDSFFIKELDSVGWPKTVAKFCGWDGVRKTDADRLFLSRLKAALGDWDDSPNSAVIDFIKSNLQSKVLEFWYFVNIREIPEIEKFKTRVKNELNIPCETILVENPRVPIITTNNSDAHVNEYNYDYYIINDGTFTDLDNKAKEFIMEVKEKNK